MRVVQRQAAASTSTRPLSNGQHLLTAGSPSPIFTKPPNKSTQAPNFSVSIGHVAFPPPDGGFTLPGGGGQSFPPVAGGVVPGGRIGPTIGKGGNGRLGPTTGGMGSPEIGGRGSLGTVTGGTGSLGTVTGGTGSLGTVTGGTGSLGTVTGGTGSLGALGECFPPFRGLQEPHARECWGRLIMQMRKRQRDTHHCKQADE